MPSLRPALALFLALLALPSCGEPPAPPAVGPAARPSTGLLFPRDQLRLISDRGASLRGVKLGGTASIVANNSAGIVSDRGAGLISDRGGAIVSDRGGAYQVLAAKVLASKGLEEQPLPRAEVAVIDASGRLLAKEEKKPYVATTDAQGRYQLEVELPAENLLLTVKLPGGGGLYGFLPKERPASFQVNLNYASTVTMGYILRSFVKGKGEILDRLPASEELRTRELVGKAIEAGKSLKPGYADAEADALMEGLRKQDRGLDEQVEKVKALLLAGLSNLGDGLLATQVSLNAIKGLASDGAGNLFVADSANQRVRRIGTEGRISTFAGNGKVGFLGDGGAATAAALGNPEGLCMGPDGSLYICDAINGRLRRVRPDGVIETLIGGGSSQELGSRALDYALDTPRVVALGPDGSPYVAEGGTKKRLVRLREGLVELVAGRISSADFSGDGGPAAQATVGEIYGLAFDKEGQLYLACTEQRRIRCIGKDGLIRTVAGTGQAGDGGDGGPALQASFQLPRGLALLADGSLLVGDFGGHRVRRIAKDGRIEAFAGKGTGGFSGDGGPATAAELRGPLALAPQAGGGVVIVDAGNSRLRRVGSDGKISTIAGTEGAAASSDPTKISLNFPIGVDFGADGRLYLADTRNNRILVREADGSFRVWAGTGLSGFSGDGGPKEKAQFHTPAWIKFGPDGHLYVTDSFNRRIRAIAPDGTVRTVAGSGRRALSPGPGPALQNSFVRPAGLAFDAKGSLYMADMEGQVVHRLRPDGVMERVAGVLDPAQVPADEGVGLNTGLFSTTNLGKLSAFGLPAVQEGEALQLPLRVPTSLACDAAANKLYVACTGDLQLRCVDLGTGRISTIAGGGSGLAKTETKAREALLAGPIGLALDPKGPLYVSEAGSEGFPGAFSVLKIPSRVRRIDPDGGIRTVAGPGSSFFAGTGVDEKLSSPMHVLLAPSGDLIISDTTNNQLKQLPKGKF